MSEQVNKLNPKKIARIPKYPPGPGLLQKALYGLLGLVLLLGAFVLYVRNEGNFNTITQGEAYRSGILKGSRLERTLKAYGIKTVINLTGEHGGDAWYRNEIETCRRLGVEHYDLGLSAVHEPTDEQITQLVAWYQAVPRPVLVHCQAGADRSGLAGALWKTLVDGRPKAEAKKQLSIVYGHLPIGPTQAMDRCYARLMAKGLPSVQTKK